MRVAKTIGIMMYCQLLSVFARPDSSIRCPRVQRSWLRCGPTPAALALALAIGVAGCSDDAGNETGTGTGMGAVDSTGDSSSMTLGGTGTAGSTTGAADEGGTGDATQVAYWQDIAPIHARSCLGCHQSSGIAFPMADYDQARLWAGPAAAAVRGGKMPPWLATSDGSCGDFANSLALTESEIVALETWAQTGTVEGLRVDIEVPDPPKISSPTSYHTPVFVPERGGTAIDEFDEYRCFLVDPKLDAPTYLTAYDVAPGNPQIVHHVIAMVVDPDAPSYVDDLSNGAVMAQLDAQSPDRLGWPCFNEAGEGVAIESTPVTWAPGQGVVEYPQGTGLAVEPGSRFVMQVHYNLADDAHIGQSDATRVDFRLQNQVERPADILLIDLLLATLGDETPTTLPPGQAAHPFVWELAYDAVLPPELPYLEIHGLTPHMHELGTQYRVEIVDAETSTCGVDVRAWDFNWQRMYFRNEALKWSPGQTLRVSCTYDTRAAVSPVYPGWGTRNEMCTGIFYVTTPNGAPLALPDMRR